MSEKIYYHSPYQTKWSTSITDIWEENNSFYAILEQTAFYPEGGGQPADTGTINGIRVQNVQITEGKIVHQLAAKPIEQQVDCALDWNVRFDHMQQHTGQHLLSAVLHELYSIPTVSFHLGKEYTTIDVEAANLDKNQLETIENLCNTYIQQNKTIKAYFITNEEAKHIPLRKLPAVTGPLRIVEIEGIDYSACAGTHVATTGELGLLKMAKTEKHRGQTRLFFLVGKRALVDYQISQQILDSLSSSMNTNKYSLNDRMEKQETENKLLLKEIERLKEENSHYLVESILSQQSSLLIKKDFADKTLKDLQYLAKAILHKKSCIVLLCTYSENKLLLQHNGNFSLHCGNLFREKIATFHGKGGGNEPQAQGTFSSQKDLNAFVDFLMDAIAEVV
ncbi:alanine--tRNA ligase-related protein [Niallia sp. NCCP-28]|uniref:alanyl-tRNA editing protein n=1 Tax=Niallia sp. NCCP-28 TaxID=2934712 RepID=UPI002083EC1A|nr:alanine--tRNA ligase-related protein [Niallia sp. NCCP-28]GKU82856.1 alanyl-tRNA editing protein [Niallia sp. NCCP-28]